MKIEICSTPHPLIRDGSAQRQRQLRELHPRYARIDDRLLSDLLVFAKAYASQVQYYNQQHQASADWQTFFDKDSACLLAEIATTEIQAQRQLTERLRQYVNDALDADKLAQSGVFGLSFDLLFSLVIQFNGYLQKAQADGALKQTLLRLLDSGLQQILAEAVASFNYASDFAWFSSIPSFTYDLNFAREQLLQQTLSSYWQAQDDSTTLAAWLALGVKDHSLFDYSASNELANLQHAGLGLLTWVDAFLQALSQLIDAAPGYLFEVVHHSSDHKAHMALYLAFIRLFKFVQIQLNQLTGQHLDFYYEKVLQFDLQPAVKDQVHLLFTLAKPVEQHLLAADTQFKAGFDADGYPVFYQLDEEAALNKALIDAPEDIKSVFIDTNGHIYRAPIANSADGLGTEFEPEQALKWSAFAKAQRAEIGFAVASPLLDLREGGRVIQITLSLSNGPSQAISDSLDKSQFSARGSTEKGWLSIPIDELEVSADRLYLELVLDPTQPGLSKFDAELHGPRNYATAQPIVEIALVAEPNGFDYAYQTLQSLQFTELHLGVEAYQLSNLVVHNDTGKLNVNGPMQPFGARPAVGSNCYVSCDEMAYKPLSWITFRFSWQDKPDDLSDYYLAYNYATEPANTLTAAVASTGLPDSTAASVPLTTSSSATGRLTANTSSADNTSSTEKKYDFSEDAYEAQFSTLNQAYWSAPTTAKLFISGGIGEEIVQINASLDSNGQIVPLFDFSPDLGTTDSYSTDKKQGFIRWQLSAPNHAFGHKVFAPIYAKRVVQLTSDTNTLLPNEPYTPVVSSIKLNYRAELSYRGEQLDQTAGLAFFHLSPFGSVQQTKQAAVPLLHGFQQSVDGELKSTEGELYLGLSQVKPPQMVSLLFQVAAGSANPELGRQPIYWSVLVNNQWQPLTSKQVVSDGTNGLNRSGIIKLIIPTEAQQDASLLADGKVWLRLAVLKDTEAVNDLISVASQAATASFADQQNAEDFLAQPLAAGSISKLAVKQAQIKSIEQPFAAQKGKPQEQKNAFRTRVSERLRHKDRGVSIWDYEKLVMQAFPDIYKVKCINHSTYLFERAVDERFTSEFAPGYVSLVVIPDLTNQYALDPLKPKVSLDQISEIEDFLRSRISPFAAEKLKVVNPLYETVQLEFTVSFVHGIDPAIYAETLNQALVAFLSPWAFAQQQAVDIHFGGKIHRSELVNFVEEQSYVDYLTDVKMHQVSDGGSSTSEVSAQTYQDILEALPHSARSILVSHPQHIIKVGDPC